MELKSCAACDPEIPQASEAKWQCSQVTGNARPMGLKKGLERSIPPALENVLKIPAELRNDCIFPGPCPTAALLSKPNDSKPAPAMPYRIWKFPRLWIGSLIMLNSPLSLPATRQEFFCINDFWFADNISKLSTIKL